MQSISIDRGRVPRQGNGDIVAGGAHWRTWMREHTYAITASGLVAFGTLLRVVLVALGWLPIDSDESVFGLMALHIAYRGERPVWYYGQQYMGALEGYIAAASFRLFGVSVHTLRLGPIVFFGLFLVAMYLLISLLYDERLALISLALLGLGTVDLMMRQLETSGHLDTLPFGATLLLLATWLALTYDNAHDAANKRRRLVAYAGWGIVAGLGLWSDLLILPFIATSGLLLVVFCWKELRSWAPMCLLLGLVVGALPLIAYNITAAPGQSTLDIIWHVQHAPIPGQPSGLSLLAQQVEATLLVSLPLAMGARMLCPLSVKDAWPLSAHSSIHTIQCTAVHAGWALGFLVLWAISALLAARVLWSIWQRAARQPWSADDRRMAVHLCGRLAILCAAGLVLALFALSPAAAADPWASERYLQSLLIAVPVAIAPLYGAAGMRREPRPLFLRSLGYVGLLLIGVALLAGTADVFAEVPVAQHVVADQEHLNATLERMGITRIYSDYWTCNRVIFQTQERIICGVLDNDLNPGQDRYMLYPAIVRASSHPAYMFPVNSPQAVAFARNIARTGARYQRLILNGYVIYWRASNKS